MINTFKFTEDPCGFEIMMMRRMLELHNIMPELTPTEASEISLVSFMLEEIITDDHSIQTVEALSDGFKGRQVESEVDFIEFFDEKTGEKKSALCCITAFDIFTYFIMKDKVNPGFEVMVFNDDDRYVISFNGKKDANPCCGNCSNCKECKHD